MNRHTIVIYLPSRGVERQRRGHARHSKGVAQAALATAPVPGRPSAAVLVTAVAASAIGSALGGEGWRRAGGGGGATLAVAGAGGGGPGCRKDTAGPRSGCENTKRAPTHCHWAPSATQT